MPNPKTINITISATTTDPYPPTLTDPTHSSNTEPGDIDFTTKVGPGDHVQFLIGGDITAITAIPETAGNLFSRNPLATNDWNGIIKGSRNNPNSTYSISYTVAGHTDTYTQDPKLTMNN